MGNTFAVVSETKNEWLRQVREKKIRKVLKNLFYI
jgi:hypothetical protein